MSDKYPADPEPLKPATCGFVPREGWSSKWARDGHRDACDTCGDIENKELYEKYGSEGMDVSEPEEEL